MKTSNEINEIAKALCIAQGAMGGASKESSNVFFKSKYADLSSVIRAIKQPFSDNGLSYSQHPISSDGLVGVTTILMHISGQWQSSDFMLRPVKADPQSAGSCLTYCRRYTLMALAGIPSEDDDGNLATRAVSSKPALISSAQTEQLNELILKTETDLPGFLTYYTSRAGLEMKTIGDLPAELFSQAHKLLQKKLNEAA
jgi:hypothetical protein|tara:strand:+ start:30 stop:626 length:597 start_codon:yes stop_codon:yes gene_type:complete